MYKCRVEKRIMRDARSHNNYTALCYELEVNSAPKPGAELHDKRWFSGRLTDVVWAKHDNSFHYRVEDELPSILGTEEFTHDWLVGNYQLQGWSPCPQKIQRID